MNIDSRANKSDISRREYSDIKTVLIKSGSTEIYELKNNPNKFYVNYSSEGVTVVKAFLKRDITLGQLIRKFNI